MKISQRLLLLVLTGLGALVLVCGVNLYQSERIFTAASFATDNTVPSLVVLGRAGDAFDMLRIRAYRYVIVDTAEDRARLKPLIDKSRAALDQALKDYEVDVADGQDGEFLKQEQSSILGEYGALEAVVAAADAGNRKEALALLIDNTATAQLITDLIARHTAYNVKLGEEGKAAAAQAKRIAFLMGGAFLLVAAALLAVLGLGTQRTISRRLQEARRTATRIAEGDLRPDPDAPEPGRCEIGELLRTMDEMRSHLAATLGQVQGSAEAVLRHSSALSTAAEQTAAASQSASDACSDAAAAIEELTVSIDEVGHNAADVRRAADGARDLAVQGGERVRQAEQQVAEVANRVGVTATQVESLSREAIEIGDITKVIREVAEQTNLLALNAAIEAARAGEQGRGFAVVADEVRKLAERTTQSVQSISQVISRIQQSAGNVVDSMQASRDMVGSVVDSAAQSGGALRSIVASSDTLRDAISEISAALGEQRTASTGVARNVESLAQNAEENANAVAVVSQTAQNLYGVAQSLQGAVATFKL